MQFAGTGLTDFGFAIGPGVRKLRVMTTSAKELIKQALALSPEERVELADTLLASVDDFASPEIEAAWREEIERRMKDFEEGRIKGIPSEEVFAKARALLDEIHKAPRSR